MEEISPSEKTPVVLGDNSRVLLARLLHHADPAIIVSMLQNQAEGQLERLPQALKGAWETNLGGHRERYLDLVHRALGDELEAIIWLCGTPAASEISDSPQERPETD